MQHLAQNDNSSRPSGDGAGDNVRDKYAGQKTDQPKTGIQKAEGPKNALLDKLRQTVSQLEARPDAYTLPDEGKDEEKAATQTMQAPARPEFPNGWAHEIWAQKPDDFTPAMAYALAGLSSDERPILWVTSPRMVSEHGLPYGPGLLRFGIDPARLVIVRAQSRIDALWAVEEGLKSAKLAAVVGEVAGIDLTESRRLSLVTREVMTRCTLLLRTAKAPSSASYSRMQLRATTSQPPHFAESTPGEPRLQAGLVKHRGGTRPHETILEWTHAPDTFPLAAPMADRTAQTGEPWTQDRATG
ncbi:ImuA family protein [Kordiimonas sp.]|uniref:ImuA family protein n=1 Tax=Kordiimonas sp. TaxID=1970157 RepID=UPI003A901128